MRYKIILTRPLLPFMMAVIALSHFAKAQQVIQLYDGRPKGSETWNWNEQLNTQNLFQTEVIYNVSQPTLTAYLPPKEMATGTAVIIAPGGGFHTLSINSEGVDLAKWLNTKGVAAFVLKYRLVHCLTDDPVKELMDKMGNGKLDQESAPVVEMAMNDGLRAVQYVREHAVQYDIDPQKIGFMGFSAGGTVTMSVVYNATDRDRPNFVAPIYAYAGAIIGSTVPTVNTPIFLAVAADDQLGLMSHSLDLFKKWQEAKQPAELHIYQKGGHGFGMRKNGLPSDTWYERFGDWMKMLGYLKKKYPSEWEKPYTEEQIEGFRKANEERQKNDWAFRSRYAGENKKIKPGEKRVVFLGNSIVENWVRMQPDFFTDNHFVGRGISGQTSQQILLRFRQDVIDLKPEIVLINAGTNDIAENTGPYDPDFTIGNIESMLEMAQANGIKVVLSSVLPATEFAWRKQLTDVPNKILDLNERIKALAQKHKVPYCDYHSALKNANNGMDPDLAEDGVHPSLKGYLIMGGQALQYVGRN
jgi:acetyl esterase/lipase/lysophospholipase L1-like esterase